MEIIFKGKNNLEITSTLQTRATRKIENNEMSACKVLVSSQLTATRGWG